MGVIDFRNDKRISPDDRKILRSHCREFRDPVELALKLGLKVIERKLDSKQDGYIVFDEFEGSESGYVIVINQDKPTSRKQFTIAHEIGHYVLHRNTLEFKKRENSQKTAVVFSFPSGNRSQGGHLSGANLPRQFEREADQFAAVILLPPQPTRSSAEFAEGRPCALANKLELSPAFVVRRFEELEFG